MSRLLLLSILICIGFKSVEQMKIGINSTSINSASLLELESTNKGLVLPRVALTSISLTSPLPATALNGTMIYNTNNTLTSGSGKGVYYWDSTNTQWVAVTPLQLPGTTNYVAKWISATTIGVSSILYDNGTNVGISTTSPQNRLDVSGAQAIGTYAGTNAAPASGLIVSGNVGLGTATPLTGAKLDVAGGFKLGSIGTLHKNIVSFSAAVNVIVPPQYAVLNILGLNVLGINVGANYVDVLITVPATLTNTLDNVFVSPTFDLPQGILLAFARVTSTTQIKIRLINTATTNLTVTGNFIVTVFDL